MGIDEMIFFCVFVQSMRWLTMQMNEEKKKAIYVKKNWLPKTERDSKLHCCWLQASIRGIYKMWCNFESKI